jgi:hypothetical protein
VVKPGFSGLRKACARRAKGRRRSLGASASPEPRGRIWTASSATSPPFRNKRSEHRHRTGRHFSDPCQLTAPTGPGKMFPAPRLDFQPAQRPRARSERNARTRPARCAGIGGAVQRRGRLSSIVLVPFLDQGREPRAHGREESRLRIACGQGDELIGQSQVSPERVIGPSFGLLPARPRRSQSMRTTSKGKVAERA